MKMLKYKTEQKKNPSETERKRVKLIGAFNTTESICCLNVCASKVCAMHSMDVNIPGP